MKKLLSSLFVLVCMLVLPATAFANHHACPQVTTGGKNVDVSRKDCSPVYVPYPVGGPKSPLPAGANQNVPLPTNQLGGLPALQTPYPNTAGNDSPPDPLGCYGPDLSFVNKGILAPTLGKPRNSDPADPYNCSGKSIFTMKVPGLGIWKARLLDVDRGGLILKPLQQVNAQAVVKVKFQAPGKVKLSSSTTASGNPLAPAVPVPPVPPVPVPPVPPIPVPVPVPVVPPVTVPPVVIPPVPLPPACVANICIPKL